MPELQDIFNRVKTKKHEKKKISESLRDAFSNSKPYQDLVEEYGRLKEKKKSLEAEIKRDFENDMAMMEQIKTDIQTDIQLMSDLALNSLMKGETIEITDEYDVKYEPLFTVKFKKLG